MLSDLNRAQGQLVAGAKGMVVSPTQTPRHPEALDTWTPGYLDTQTPGHLDSWTPGNQDTQTAEHLEQKPRSGLEQICISLCGLG